MLGKIQSNVNFTSLKLANKITSKHLGYVMRDKETVSAVENGLSLLDKISDSDKLELASKKVSKIEDGVNVEGYELHLKDALPSEALRDTHKAVQYYGYAYLPKEGTTSEDIKEAFNQLAKSYPYADNSIFAAKKNILDRYL